MRTVLVDAAVWYWGTLTGRRRRCPHARQRCIHGDEIIAAGYRRARCLDCWALLRPLPKLCSADGITGHPHLSVDR